jgi:excisionase family DNA binding protein
MVEENKLTLTVREVQRRLGLSRGSVYKAVRTGAIPSIKIGRRILIPIFALQRRLEERPANDGGKHVANAEPTPPFPRRA